MNKQISRKEGEALSYTRMTTNKCRRNGGVRKSLCGNHRINSCKNHEWTVNLEG